MSPLLNLRTPLACVLICTLFVSGLISITTRQSHASNNSLTRSFTPGVNESSEETVPQAVTADEATRSRVTEAYGKLPLSFEENRGQVDSEVKYVSRGSGYTLFLTATEAVLALQQSIGKKATTTAADPRHSPVPAQPRPTRTRIVRMKLSGANPSPAVTGESEMGVRTNYFIGNDPEKWHPDVARYERVRYSQVYPGVDMTYYGEQQQLEYDFEVAPFAESRRIALEFAGVKRVKVERETGDLVLKTAGGEVRQHKPVAYQEVGGERQEVESRYVLKGKRKVGIEVGEYDRTQRLVIDPVLSYSTYLGGSGDDSGQGIAVDSAGHVYVTGYTDSTDFPTKNQYQTFQGNTDAFVTKLDTNASGAASLLYSTYLGGSSDDYGQGIAVDASGNAYVTGYTGSADFPTKNQYQTFQGGWYFLSDAFVTKLDTNGSGAASLLYSTYLGGTRDELGNGIAVDASGNAYVTGYTDSTDFPTKNQYQTFQEVSDAFVTKLDTNASGAASLLYSTYLGGNGTELSRVIAVDASGYAYVTGPTFSTDFPTKNQYQTYQGSSTAYDSFVTKLDTNASGAASLLYSTYLGGSDADDTYGIAVDSSGHAYVTGYTFSTDYPTLNEYQTYQGTGQFNDAFVTKLDTNASGAASLLYSTYLGGEGVDRGQGIAVDSSGNVYVTGDTFSENFPILNQYQTSHGGDVFVTKLNPNLSGVASLLYSTYLGGSAYDSGYGIAVDTSGHAYVTGFTGSANFPRLHQYQSTQGGYDAFVTKLADTTMIGGRVTSDGTIGLGGVTVTLSGSQSRTVLTNGNGDYSFLNLPPGGDYTVTPSKGDVTFIPSEQSFSDLHTNQTDVDFITRPATISGKIAKDTADGAGLAGATITLTDGADFTPRIVTTASDGTYSFHNLPTPGNYKITPSKTNYSFSPAQLVLYNVTADQTTQNFVATPKTYTVSGVVKLGAAGLSGVTVKLSSPSPAGFTPRTTTTSSTGAYSFTGVPAGRNYTVTPQKTGYQFTPTSKSLATLSANQTAVNFAVKVYSIAGRITRAGTTNGIGAVTVTLTSPTPAGFAARTVQTTSTGYYTFTNVPAGRNYTLKPTKTGFTFTPATRSITNLSGNVGAGAATNFTGAGP